MQQQNSTEATNPKNSGVGKVLFLGILLGVALSLIAYAPIGINMKNTAFSNGYKKCQDDYAGTLKEKAEKTAQVARLEVQLDSLATALEKFTCQPEKPHYKKPVTRPAIQNWHVIGNKIADPITDEPAKPQKGGLTSN